MTHKPIDRQTAKQIVDDVDFGYLVVGRMEPVPTIGEVDPDEREVKTDVEMYRFGTASEVAENDE